MNRISYLFLLIFFINALFSKNEEVGIVDEIEGEITIKPATTDIIPSSVIIGRSLYSGDIIHSGENGRMQISLAGSNNKITLFGLSKLKINKEGSSFQLELNYGDLFAQFSNDHINSFTIITQSSKIIQNEGELWITRNFTNDDHVFAILGDAQISNSGTSTELKIEMGNMVISDLEGFGNKMEITEKMLPPEIFNQYNHNLNIKEEDAAFTVMNYFSDDSSFTRTSFNEEEKRDPFKFSLEVGTVSIAGEHYTKASILPLYFGKRFHFGYNISGFLGVSDTAANLNTFSTLSQLLAPMTFQYQSSNKSYKLKLGQINNLTFGHGMLIKRYTNTINYPVQQDGGMVLNFKSDAGNYTYELFTSSIGELVNGGGLVGVYGSGAKLPYRLGVGFVSDLNQFSSVSDSIWNGITPHKRSISGYQLDITYELKSDLRNDIYLFGEFATLNYADDIRYIRSGEDTKEHGFERQSSFGIMAPGIWWKIGNHRDIKIAFNFVSSLYMSPFFSETYNLERMHYISASVLDSLEKNEPYSEDEKWLTMITKNHIDSASTGYYLPKDIYALLDPTKNVHNKIGVSMEYSYQYRNLYNYSFDISILKEIESAGTPTTYYTFGMDIFIQEGVIQGISECGLYFNQYFTSELFNTSNYSENMVLGGKLGIKLRHNVSLRIYRHDVFYDRNLDNKVTLNSTMGIGMVANF
ncbi:MAG: hypothetical protein QF380_05235 [Candidatus Marinimicrobia bacterium]|jgi:hypothetical protein|nr:hypothetical protein [Candidatus Neomarinimicrobiota bacterium]